MSENVQTAYITEEDGVCRLCVIESGGAFHRFPISTVTLSRLASECARAVWGDLIKAARIVK